MGFKVSNNEAKYEALLAGLDIVYSVGVKHLRVFCDSQLVVNQINGDFKVRDGRMKAYYKKKKSKIEKLEKVEIS